MPILNLRLQYSGRHTGARGVGTGRTFQSWAQGCLFEASRFSALPYHHPIPHALLLSHTLSTTATAAAELFLFGGYAHRSYRNDLYVFSTRDFSTTLLQTSGEIPGPRQAHGAVLTGTLLLVWGGLTKLGQDTDFDDSLYLLNLGMSHLLMSTPAPADQSFLPSSIARVDPRRGRWSQALRSLLPYRDFGWFQSLRFRWPDHKVEF